MGNNSQQYTAHNPIIHLFDIFLPETEIRITKRSFPYSLNICSTLEYLKIVYGPVVFVRPAS